MEVSYCNLMIETVIFDFDGVLINSEAKSVTDNYNFLVDNGIENPNLKELKALVGTTDIDNYIYMARIMNISVEEATKLNLEYQRQHPYKGKELVFPEAVTLLQYLKKKKIKVAIASNSILEFVQTMLDEAEITEFFDYVISGREFGAVKPDPTIYIYTANKCETNADKCLVVEDSPVGIKAAINAKMKVVGLYSDFLKLDVSEADYVVNNLKNIINIIEEENKYD